MKVVATIGIDQANLGVFYVIEVDGEHFDAGGWPGKGPKKAEDPAAWLALLQRRVCLPAPVKARHGTWSEGRVSPYGWSQGPGHAPYGITITWEV